MKMAKYYEMETPVTVITEKGEFRYYKEAKRLQVSKPKWKDMNDEVRMGKTVTLDLNGFKGNEDLKALLNQVLADLD